MGVPAVLLAALLVITPALALVPGADACAASVGVPCGRIYPAIILQIPDQPPRYDLARGEVLSLDAKLVFRFDALTEGYTVAGPNDPVFVTFEFPRKPVWVDLRVEPERIEIPVNNPTYIRPDAADPNNVQGHYIYETQLRIEARVTGQPVLRDGYDYAKLLVFGKSSESGLYQSGYGIKEIRILPEGAVHEADVASQRDRFVATPLADARLAPTSATLGASTLTLTPPATAAFWEPAPFEFTFNPPPTGRVAVAIHDETGALVAQHGPVGAAPGRVAFPVTLAAPGLHTATVTLLPEPGTRAPSATAMLNFIAGDLAPEGIRFPKAYLVTVREAVPLPAGPAPDPFAQFERDIPFFAFDRAQSVVASLNLVTPGADLGRAAANLQFSVHDPDGKLLGAQGVDPTNPTRSVRVGALPGDGWYTLRIRGTGAPGSAIYEARVEVTYAQAPEMRNRADGVADRTPGVINVVGRNLTLPTDTLSVWTPSDLTPMLDGVEDLRYAITVVDAQGHLVLATGVRDGPATFTPPAPGTYRAAVFVEPKAGGVFSPFTRVVTFVVGEGETIVATSYDLKDSFRVPVAFAETRLASYRLPTPATPSASTSQFVASPGVTLRFELEDASGTREPVQFPGPVGGLAVERAPWLLHVYGSTPVPTSTASFDVEVTFADPVTMEGPAGLSPTGAKDRTVSAAAVAVIVALAGAGAVALAFFRRR